MRWITWTLWSLVTALGCRTDPGTPDYGPMQTMLDAHGALLGPLPGPSPYVPGTPRLSLGLFYEGGSSDALPIDGITRHYYIFTLEGTNQLTYTQQTVNDRIEGLQADELTMNGTPWWGGGILWDKPIDLSGWTTLHVSLRSSDPGLANLELRMLHGTGAPQTVTVQAKDFGWQSDGDWHHLSLPLAAFAKAGVNLQAVRGPLLWGGTGAKSGETLLVDDLYIEGGSSK